MKNFREDKEVVKEVERKIDTVVPQNPREERIFRKDKVVYTVKFHRQAIIDLLKAV